MALTYTRDVLLNPDYAIGEHTYGEPKIIAWQNGTLKIGKFCSIAPNVTIMLDGNHNMEDVTTYPLKYEMIGEEIYKGSDRSPIFKYDVDIGHDVWICYGATILPGVTIGHGAVIGAMSVVTKDVEPYAIVGGNPAKPIRKRFDDAMIERLLKLQWWDWSDEKIRENISLVYRSPTEALFNIQ